MRLGVLVGVLLLGASLPGCSDGAPRDEAPDTARGMLRGTVLTQAIVPIAAAVVELAPVGIKNLTDDQGRFLFGPLEAGSYRLLASAPGYGTVSMDIRFDPAASEHVSVLLPATGTDVPYHEVQQLSAYVQCSYAQRFAGVIGGNFNCLGITDLLLGIQLGNDVDHFVVPVNGGGFRGMLVEMVWEEQDTMPNWSAYLRSQVDAGGGVGLEDQYWSAVSRNPLVAMVLQGVENSGAYSGDVFHPDPDADAEYEYLIAGMSDTTQPVDVAIALDQELEIFLSKFYHALPGDDYGFVRNG